MHIIIGPAVFWLIILILMLAIELPTMGFTTIWFAGGALLTMFLSLTGVGATVQMIIFLAVSIFLLVSVRPWAKDHFNNSRTKTNSEALVGQEAVVIEAIDNVRAKGRISVNGMEWAARSADVDRWFDKGEVVIIKEIDGVKLIVAKKTQETNGMEERKEEKC